MAYIVESYITEFDTVYSDLLTSSTKAGTPYDTTIQFIKDLQSNSNIIEKEYIQYSIQAMVAIMNSVTVSTQNTAMKLIDKKYKFDKELAQLDANLSKTNADIDFRTKQGLALDKQVVDNEKIKASQILGDTYQGFGTNGLDVTSDMWTTFFNLVNDIYPITSPTTTGVVRV